MQTPVKTLTTMLILFILISSCITFSSCNNEELFIEPTSFVILETDEPVVDTNTPAEDTNSGTTDSTAPCDFTLETVQDGDTIIIDCMMDLGGQTINLPANVTIIYDGGDIINGTLNFSDNSFISGELFNSTLTLGGNKPLMKDPVFEFIPSRWGIVEGEVTQEVAKRNSEIIHDIILITKELGGDVFVIDQLDAYFYQGLYEYIFELPSDFHLKMSDNTHIRVFPTKESHNDNGGFDRGNLIYILNSQNVTVTGGYLYGDRDEHNYSSGGTHEFGHLIKIRTGTNVKIENVHMSNSIGDGLDIESHLHEDDPLYIGSSGILISGCSFDSNRRNNLSITDGRDIIVENCNFLNAGINTFNSLGTAPRYAIDIEPFLTQRVDRVIIRNNTEIGSAGGALIVMDGDDILVTGNSFEKVIGISWATNVKIRNNPNLQQVVAGRDDVIDNRNYEISGNNISNPTGSGIYALNPGVQIFDNTITGCKAGMQIQNLKEANIYNNTIEGNEDGINAFGGGNNVIIEDNVINVNRPFLFIDVNEITIRNNTVNSSDIGYFQSSYGIKIDSNSFTSGVRLEGTANAILQNNSFTLEKGTAINIRGNSNNMQILDNYFENEEPSSHGIYGEGDYGNTTFGDVNVIINNNEFKNFGIYSRGYDGFIIKNNNGFLNDTGYIDFNGNNSFFENNRGLSGEIYGHYIFGSNNSIIN